MQVNNYGTVGTQIFLVEDDVLDVEEAAADGGSQSK